MAAMDYTQLLADGSVALGLSLIFGFVVRSADEGFGTIANGIACLPEATQQQRLAWLGVTAMHGLPVYVGLLFVQSAVALG